MEILDVQEDLNFELMRDFRGMKDGFVQVGERKWLYPSKYRELARDYKNFEVRSSDIWITGYPRSGTTVTEELVWQLSHNLDFEGSRSFNERVRFLENSLILSEKNAEEIKKRFPEEAEVFQDYRDTLKILNSYETRRVIKTHLPFELLPSDIFNKGCKIIYVCRFPKDVCVSYFHLQANNRISDFCADFQKYWKYFRNGNSTFGPYFEHIKQGFKRIGSENFMFTFYEEFSKDSRSYIQKLSHFLEIPLTEEELTKLEKHIHIDNFRKVSDIVVKDNNNQMINFIRRGKVGGWKDYFTEEMNNDADAWIEMNTKNIGIKYPQQKE